MSVLSWLQRLIREIFTQSPQQRVSRVLVKTLLYRVVMVVITIVVAFVITGNTADALSIGIASNVIKTVVYYGYERVWDRITWGVEVTDG